MQVSPVEVESRREFFRAAARYGLLTLVAAVSGLAARPWTPAGRRCMNRGVCGGCGLFAGCGLPQALSARRARTGG
ncbi:MAG: hypothetical protein WCL11_12450 [Verrucomicrobiota bacterium]